MNPCHRSVFDLPDGLAAKAAPALVAGDEEHFAAIQESLDDSGADLSRRLADLRRAPGGGGQKASDRDQQIHRLAHRLSVLQRLSQDLCLGRLLPVDGTEPVYVGRLGLADRTGRRLLVDWRSPIAEPFFAATHASPMGLSSRRRYRWSRGRVVDYWDEVFRPDGIDRTAALDDQSAFIASLGASRSGRMRDVLSTIQADQDAIIRAPAPGTLVVDGGPGTGKTVVALHRAAYLLYSDTRVARRGLLFVGPHQPYLAYVADVLPNLGEDGVQVTTLRGLVTEGGDARDEPDSQVARLKSSARLVGAIEAAVRFYEEPPTAGTEVPTPWQDLWLSPDDWAEAFSTPDPGSPHNESRDLVWETLITILADRVDAPTEVVRRTLARTEELRSALARSWPLIEAADLVGDLWSVPAYLRRCAPWLTAEQVRTLQRAQPLDWTVADLPFLDAARRRLGDPQAARRRQLHDAQVRGREDLMSRVVDDLIASDDSEMAVMSMLRGTDLQGVLVAGAIPTGIEPDPLAGPFAHIVVDEAQELTDAEWTMVLSRCPSRSLTVVGDRAQSRHGFAQQWQERLGAVGLGPVTVARLSINYRTPREVMAQAEPVIRAVDPDANVPTSIRSTNVPVAHGSVSDLESVLRSWLDRHDEGTACVIGTCPTIDLGLRDTPRIRFLTPVLCKGLEFDLVVMLDPDSFGAGHEGAVDRYVAMTRATQELVILTSP